MKKLFLHKYHTENGATFFNVQNHTIPSDYGNVKDELNYTNNSIALLDRSYLGKILVEGEDSLDLLNRISTNDLQYLAIGTVCDTIFVTPKGRLIDYCRIISIGLNQFVLICSFCKTEHLIDWINRFVILEDVTVSDISNKYVWLTLLGPHCQKFLNNYSSSTISENDEAIWLESEAIQFPALKNTNFNIAAYNFCLPVNEANILFSKFISMLKKLNGNLIGDTVFQIIRVESGMPDWGTEITQDYNPHEARLIKAVSFTKGCYTGQEIIARLDTYDKVQKYLMIIDIFENINQDPPIEVFIEDDLVGYLTSYVYNPISEQTIGLGYIKKMFAIENDLYVELNTPNKRVPAKLRKPPVSY